MAMTRDESDAILSVEEIDKVGVVSLDDWLNSAIYERAKKLLPEARSIVVLALEVLLETAKYLTSQTKVGEMTLRDLHNRSMDMVNGQLDWEAYRLVKRLHKLGYKGLPLPSGDAPYDSRFIESALSYKLAAKLAGLGTIGWHSMLLTPEYGARVRLACVITDAPLPASVSTEAYYPCPECGGACIRICPVSAIKEIEDQEGHSIDKYKCSTYLVASGGCAECLRVCPAGQPKKRVSPAE